MFYPGRLTPRRSSDVPESSPLPEPVGDLLDALELSRMRLLALLGLIVSANVFFLLPLLGGDATARHLFRFCLAASLVASSWLLFSLSRSEGYGVARLVVAGAAWLAAGVAGVRYFGVASPVGGVLVLGVLFFGVTRDSRLRVAGYVASAVAYLAVALLTLRARSGEPAIVSASALTTIQAALFVSVTEVVLLAAFIFTRMTHAATLLALARSERAMRALARKDAVLAELQRDLARAIEIGGIGRYSDTLVGSYALGEVIGRGAMGEVYAGVHTETHAEAAVKILHASMLREPGSVECFVREAKTAQALETPHAVRILEVGGAGGGVPYLAMERLRGRDLAELLRLQGRLGLHDVLRLLSHVGAGLEALRRAGVVHRDLKPRNIFLCEGDAPDGGVWKLLDFGLSTRADPEGDLAEGGVVGTPEYVAPEQAAGRAVGHKADLFSLGAIAYRALTGSSAFTGDHLAEVLYQVTHGMPARPSLVADLTLELDLVLAVALAKDPADRFESAEELRGAIEAAARGEVSDGVRRRALEVLARTPWSETAAAPDEPG